MDKTSTDQYGRKSWNVEAYEAEAKKGQQKKGPSEEAKAAASRLAASGHLQQRAELLNESITSVKKRTLIADSALSGRKRFGFTCPICDLSFRDTLALVDHINSPQHARKAQELARIAGTEGTGEVSNGIRHATPEEVSQTIELLVAKKLRENAASKTMESMQERVRKRAAFMEKRSSRRKEKRQKKKGGQEVAEEESEMAKTMGFGGFGSTKVA
ncbi:hypothetical protein FT663_00720 [Candidozyma haemuli var. vulneris]|uniref:C2H2-type domain-containing protein n=1 Tax=Candidozyma haemuli TaxID=45357 RepID=A0A2V1AQP1_9ASCO|nr:hypothetical protein CXQ85_003684 [[Candida] haemuloni]KAF3992440.1 hypothetical protein FT662_01149 [[Candida] haemuloni var. vulneris]KAF3995177.1 hypothetical protein FT663_00720 [[Candida] haemuloni var. vulneris]PVH19826.1 hypothetical protein CXQ85_003684 [[Candida] haemuloni]